MGISVVCGQLTARCGQTRAALRSNSLSFMTSISRRLLGLADAISFPASLQCGKGFGTELGILLRAALGANVGGKIESRGGVDQQGARQEGQCVRQTLINEYGFAGAGNKRLGAWQSRWK